MGLFSSIKRNISRALSDVRDIGKALVPTLVPLALGGIAGFGLSRFLPKLLAGGPPMGAELGAGGVGAVVQANLQRFRPPIGFLGNQVSSANPLFRAATSPGFNVNALPARPDQGRNALIAQLLQLLQGPAQQTTSFNQGALGATVAPSFRPFASSFRAGGFGFSGGFRPGFSRGLAPQFPQQFAQPRVGGFGGFGGFGGGFF